MRPEKIRTADPEPIISTIVNDVDLRDIKPDDIRLDVAARVLSRVPRYGAQSDVPFSVMQHLFLCDHIATDAGIAEPDIRLQVLLHDVHEYLIGDFPTPLKRMLNTASGGLIKTIEHRIDTALYESLGLDTSLIAPDSVSLDIVKVIDRMALRYEVTVVYPSVLPRWDIAPGDSEIILELVEELTKLEPQDMERWFMDRVNTLLAAVEAAKGAV